MLVIKYIFKFSMLVVYFSLMKTILDNKYYDYLKLCRRKIARD